MLREIHIRNFALAERLDMELQPGLNILTGETGTGKSILVGAISAVLGGRVYTEVVRTGAQKAVVEATFDISDLPEVKQLLAEKGLDANSELFLRREISTKGNTRAFVNDVPVTISTLAEIGDHLVDIHGQSEHQSLLKKESHRFFLDAFGQLQPLLAETRRAYQAARARQDELRELRQKQKSLDEKYEFYRFQLNEIDKAALQPGEEEALEAERHILINSEKIFQLSGEFNALASGGDSVNLQELLRQALHVLRELSQFSGDLEAIYREFSSAKIIVEEAARSVEEFQSRLEFNPARLEEIEQRLATLAGLKKKYGGSVEEILRQRERIQAELDLRENFDLELKKLQRLFQEAVSHFRASAVKLSDARRKVARRLESAVETLLQQIGMPKMRFRVQLDRVESPEGLLEIEGRRYLADEYGLDQVEFYISPNPGEDFKPLVKIASGGEISRIMLALKNILAEIDRIPLLIFDEIDTGVSGRIALSVGKNIRRLAHSHQVICITHLPQIASFGTAHYRVEKLVRNGRTFTRVVPLAEPQRVEELARLMGGEQIGEAILSSARQLIAEAKSIEKE